MNIKKLLAIPLAVIMLCSCAANDTSDILSDIEDVPAVTEQALTGKTSAEIVADMGFGFNVGNTLDADSGKVADVLLHEVAWGNPVINQQLIDGIASAGFTTIRIPTTWESFVSEDESYTIDPEYLARVKEVVDYCYKHEMYVILNTHHEKWIENPDLISDKEEIAAKLGAIWSQIADYFADYDQHLIFEGLNEPRLKGTDIEWTGNPEAYEVMNYLAQVFVNAVRGNAKGHNSERCLMITGYAASNSASVMRAMSIPTYNGDTVNNLIISVHSYSPYDFCLSSNQQEFDLNNPTDTGAIDAVFTAIKSEFLDHGIPVVIGETGTTGKANEQARVNWVTYMATKAAEYGTPIVLWDNGSPGTGGENHCYFNRSTGELISVDFVNAMMQALKDTEWGCAMKNSSTEEKGESLIDGNVIVSFADGKTSEKEWDYTYISTTAAENYYYGNRNIAVVFTGDGEPKMILDSSELNQWWMPVDPDRIETVGDNKVAYFSSDNIMKVIEGYGLTSFSQLRNMAFLAADGSITTYEVSVLGESTNVVFKVNGATYHVGSDMPENPIADNLEFLGWYTTKDYRSGTEFTGAETDGDTTVYAKFGLK